MVKSGKMGLATVLGLIMGLTLFTSGASAQSINPDNAGAKAQVAVATTILQGVSRTSASQPQQIAFGGPRGGGFRGGDFRGGGFRGGGFSGGFRGGFRR